AVGVGYPLYGDPITEPAAPLASLIGGGRVLVHESLLMGLGRRVGDRLKVGEGNFTVSGILRQEPDRAVGVFSLGPRVLIGLPDLEGTHLVRPGSRVRHRLLFRLPAGEAAESFRDELPSRLPDPSVRVTTSSHAQPAVRPLSRQL